MTRQTSEDRIVLEGGRMPAPTHRPVPDGRAIRVDLPVKQFERVFATAENPQGPGAVMVGDVSPSKTLPGPTADANAALTHRRR